MITEILTDDLRNFCLPRDSDEFSQHRGVFCWGVSAAEARVMIHRLKYFKSYLNIFDALLVVAGSEIAHLGGIPMCCWKKRPCSERSSAVLRFSQSQVVGIIDMIILEELIDGGGGVNLVVLRFLRIIKLARTLRALRFLTAFLSGFAGEIAWTCLNQFEPWLRQYDPCGFSPNEALCDYFKVCACWLLPWVLSCLRCCLVQ